MNILISFLGSTLDQHGRGPGRWGSWRPSVALAMQEDLHFDRYFLLYQRNFETLCQAIIQDIQICSPDTEVIPELIDLDNPWDFEEVYSKLYDFSRAKDFSAEEHHCFIHITTGTHVAQICLFLLNESHHLPGRLIQTQPTRRNSARGTYTIIDLDLSRYDLLAKRFAVERENDLDFLKSGIATRNRRFNALIETIERVAIRSREPLLLSGPTGAGKSRLAKRIYELKKMNRQISGSFVEVNCATLRGDQAMSTLFGHVKGSFTGAVKDRPGLLKTADQGILFLDEIGELGLDEQAMLLRAVEEKVFLPLGADREDSSSFQLICGTNRELGKAVREGCFRADLLQRINLWSFELPGLAERREDIEPNIDYELEQFCRKAGRHITFNREARQMFLAFALDSAREWHGNFRELNAMMTRMATLAPGGRIDAATVRDEIGRTTSSAATRPAADAELAALLGDHYTEQYDRFDLAQLAEVIKVCRQSRSLSEAGRQLFAVSRQNKTSSNDADRLAKYLARFRLTWTQITGADRTVIR
ncbi:RNA repair transcriptional activator RtcR [Victivallis sp. Marseille-Q1083]|uniref:RNA repair transcriptional activator RtcR n=1 Tax=Victivallis sp. Marseille-Q1083 TaxID=2717288 RepID=UPI00158C77B3|nr:RNA repair transcriptional activator RtcR [Victivallis sp. Marseille-Q1083]